MGGVSLGVRDAVGTHTQGRDLGKIGRSSRCHAVHSGCRRSQGRNNAVELCLDVQSIQVRFQLAETRHRGQVSRQARGQKTGAWELTTSTSG